MLKKLITIALFLIQTYLIMMGRYYSWKDFNPFIILACTVAIFILYINSQLDKKPLEMNQPMSSRLIGFGIGLLFMSIYLYVFRRMLWGYPNPGSISDILPQLETQYGRFIKGVSPYSPLDQLAWHPYPVYMPMHWLPLGLAYLFHFDVRLIGMIALVVVNGFWGSYIWGKEHNILLKIVAIFLPTYMIQAFWQWERVDLAVSMETLIAAYYLLLAVGLLSRNLVITTIAIILCLLSRYTLVFWLPLFIPLLFINEKKKYSLYIVTSMAIAVLVFYIIPFYLKDPTILSKGIAYHNSCAISEWAIEGYTFRSCVYFAPFFAKILPGAAAQQIFLMRTIQAIIMIGLVIMGFVLYGKWKNRINFYDLCLGILYLVVFLFYIFGALTYTYYYATAIVLSAVLVAMVLLSKQNRQR